MKAEWFRRMLKAHGVGPAAWGARHNLPKGMGRKIWAGKVPLPEIAVQQVRAWREGMDAPGMDKPGMKRRYSMSEMQRHSRTVMKAAEQGVVAVFSHRVPVAYVVAAHHFDRWFRGLAEEKGLIEDDRLVVVDMDKD